MGKTVAEGRARRGEARAFAERAALCTDDGCLEWPFAKQQRGYGMLSVDGELWRAHRYVLYLATLANPPKLDAAHSCGNPECVNRKHLRWATRADNLADRQRHGTLVAGDNASWTKIPDGELPTIRKLYADGMTQAEIGKQYSVGQPTISLILNGLRRKG